MSLSFGDDGDAVGRPDAGAELLREARRLELRTRRLVDSRFRGEYHSVFKGPGLEFAEVREYLHGDDVRSIDWNVTARLGVPHVKRFVEERELTVLLLVDVSGSQCWGSARRKDALAAELAATLALSAVRNNDRVGLLLASDRVERFVPPRKRRGQVLRVLRDLLSVRPASARTDLSPALRFASRALRARSIVFLISDFHDPGPPDRWPRALAVAARRHDLIPVHLQDPADFELPRAGLLSLRDPETGDSVALDTSDAATRRAYAERLAAEQRALARLFRQLGLDSLTLRTDRPIAPPLLGFLRRRARYAAQR